MIRCPKCSRELQDGSKFCTGCGFALNSEQTVAEFYETATYRAGELEPLFQLETKNEPWFRFVVPIALLLFINIVSGWQYIKETYIQADWSGMFRSPDGRIEALARILGALFIVGGVFCFFYFFRFIVVKISIWFLPARLNKAKRQTGNSTCRFYEDRYVSKTDSTSWETKYDSVLKIFRTKDAIGLNLKGNGNALVVLLKKFMTKGDFDELTAFLEQKTGCSVITGCSGKKAK